MPYTLIDHTADFGLHLSSPDLKSLFAEAGEALFDQITDRNALSGKEKILFDVDGNDLPDLMVNWLRELLYLWNGKEFLVKGVLISTVSEIRLAGTVWGDPFEPGRHAVHNEIKAVTYHGIEVSPRGPGWEAVIIFDV